MEDCKELVIIKILSELQEKYDINNLEVKEILDRNLADYTLLSNETSLMASDIEEKTFFFICLKRLQGLSEESLKSYTYELGIFSRYIRKPVNQITTNDIRGYLSIIKQEKNYENITLNNKISILRTFFATMIEEEVILKNPMAKIKNLKVNVKDLREALTAEELEVVRNELKDIREKALVEFLVSSGTRVSEVAHIKLTNINWEECSLEVTGKGNKVRKVYFSIKCKLYLKEYLNTRTDKTNALFVGERLPHKPLGKSGIEKLMTKISDRVNLGKVFTPHTFRHTFAVLALQKGMDIVTIQYLLGHESVSTTQIYAKSNDKLLKIAYDKYIAA